jgi:endonuclease/exonuclease/phosphatase family metal-dependent hydrolase
MKILSLNIQGGMQKEKLLPYLREEALTTDVFCLQETFQHGKNLRHVFDGVDPEIHQVIAEMLPEYQGFWAPSQPNEEGLSIFIRNGNKILSHGNIFIYRWLGALEGEDSHTLGRNMQYIEIEIAKERLFIGNFHGLWAKNGRSDTPERDEQTSNLLDITKRFGEKQVLVGDFNLTPHTNSIRRKEEKYVNLISKYNITTTKPQSYVGEERCIDYIFTSESIEITHFEVPSIEVSDHLPLIVEFNI